MSREGNHACAYVPFRCGPIFGISYEIHQFKRDIKARSSFGYAVPVETDVIIG